MKTKIISAISACLFSLMVVNSASAQQPARKMLPTVTISPADISIAPRVLKAFNRSFAGAESVKWYQLNNRFMVKFNQSAMNHHAVYLKGGAQVYHIGYGFENNLPADIKNLVKAQYGGYSINRTYTVDQDNANTWMVSMQSPSEYILAGVSNGQVREISRLQKQLSPDQVISMNKKK